MRQKDISSEIDFINKTIQRVASELSELQKKVPAEAKLRTTRNGNVYQYFIREKGTDTNGKYIKKAEMEKAEILAQIEYDEKLILILQRITEDWKKLETDGAEDPFEYTLEQMAPGKRVLIKPPYITDECYLNTWKKQEFERLTFREDTPEFYTKKGLRVRSKSEVIIAEMLDDMNIPFIYEKPLKLKNEIVHPDFTLLDIKDRKEIYWEHFGMMDDMEYRNNAFYKIRSYESNGYCQHDTFIWTFETSKYPLNTKAIRKMIVEMKKRLGYE